MVRNYVRFTLLIWSSTWFCVCVRVFLLGNIIVPWIHMGRLGHQFDYQFDCTKFMEWLHCALNIIVGRRSEIQLRCGFYDSPTNTPDAGGCSKS